MIWYYVALALTGVIFTSLLFVKGKTSWGSSSSSLTSWRVLLGFTFIVVLLDTGNDLIMVAMQTEPSKVQPGPTSKKRTRTPSGGRSKPSNIRNVVAKKYDLLGYMISLAFFLYLLSRPETWNFLLDLMLAFRGIDSRAKRNVPNVEQNTTEHIIETDEDFNEDEH